jgi:hypothetical protein
MLISLLEGFFISFFHSISLAFHFSFHDLFCLCACFTTLCWFNLSIFNISFFYLILSFFLSLPFLLFSVDLVPHVGELLHTVCSCITKSASNGNPQPAGFNFSTHFSMKGRISVRSLLMLLPKVRNCLCKHVYTAADPEVRVRFPELPDFLKSNGSGTGSGLEIREYAHRDPSSWPRDTLYPQKLALTSLTSGGQSVYIVRSRSHATAFFFWSLFMRYPARFFRWETSLC